MVWQGREECCAIIYCSPEQMLGYVKTDNGDKFYHVGKKID